MLMYLNALKAAFLQTPTRVPGWSLSLFLHAAVHRFSFPVPNDFIWLNKVLPKIIWLFTYVEVCSVTKIMSLNGRLRGRINNGGGQEWIQR